MLWLVYGLILMAFLDNFIQLPVMSPYASSLGSGLLMTAAVISAYSFSNMIGNLGAGWIIGHIGRKNAILIGLLTAAAAVGSYALASNPAYLLSVRILHGLGMAVVVPAAFSCLADGSSREDRGRQMAHSGVVIACAALLGPPLGGILQDRFGIEWVFYTMTALLLLSAWAIRQRFPEELTHKQLDKPMSPWPLLKRADLLQPYIAAFVLLFAKGTLAFALPLVAKEKGFSSATTGILFSTFAVVAILVFISPLNRISDRLGRQAPMLLGLVLIAGALGGLALADTLGAMVLFMSIYGLGFGFLFPSATASVADNADRGERSAAFGVFYGMFSLGVVVGPLASGYLAQTWAISPFAVAALTVLSGALVIFGIRNRAL